MEFAQALAVRVMREAKGDDAEQLRHAFHLCLARDPNSVELERLQTLFSTLERELAGNAKEAQRLAPRIDLQGVTPARAAAWTLVSRAFLNLDEFITRE